MADKTPVHDHKTTNPSLLKVTEDTELLKFLIQQLQGKSRHDVKSLLSHRQISVGNRVETQFDFPLKSGQEVSINRVRVAEEVHCRGLKILFEDESLIVIDKDSGLLSMASETENINTAYSILSRRLKRKDPQILLQDPCFSYQFP